MADDSTAAPPKLRSRSYPVIPLAEAVELLRHLDQEIGQGGHDRSAIATALGYAGKSGIAARKAAALAQFGFLEVRGGLYYPTPLGADILIAKDEPRRGQLLREAVLHPELFQEVLSRYQEAGRVPRQLALTLSQHHGIQEHARDEVARIFMQSALHAGILAGDGSFKSPAEAEQPQLSSKTQPPAEEPPARLASGRQVLRFEVTERKEVIFDLPARLEEQDIVLLRMQIDFLELQAKQNRPDLPVRFDIYRGNRKS